MLQEAVDAMVVARAADDAVAYARADTRFHEAFIKNCVNRYLEEGYALVAGRDRHLAHPSFGADPRGPGAVLRPAPEMLQAFTAGDVLTLEFWSGTFSPRVRPMCAPCSRV